MKLVLRRDQRKGMLGKIIFSLSVRAEITPEEHAAIQTYKLGATILYDKKPIIDPGSGLLGAASRIAHRAMTISVSVNDLTEGKQIDCKDIVEMLAVEEQIRDAGKTFNDILKAASGFGGEEVIDLAA